MRCVHVFTLIKSSPYMKNVFLKIVVLSYLLSGCAGKNHNSISSKSIQSIINGTEALVLIQTTPIVSQGKFGSASERIETHWFNLLYPHNIIWTRNYRSIYILDTTYYSHHDIELYVVKPGKYSLNNLKYLVSRTVTFNLSHINDFASFVIKGGEVLYLGHLTFNIRDHDMSGINFLNSATEIQDDYNAAKYYMDENYPTLSSRLQKKLIILHNTK